MKRHQRKKKTIVSENDPVLRQNIEETKVFDENKNAGINIYLPLSRIKSENITDIMSHKKLQDDADVSRKEGNVNEQGNQRLYSESTNYETLKEDKRKRTMRKPEIKKETEDLNKDSTQEYSNNDSEFNNLKRGEDENSCSISEPQANITEISEKESLVKSQSKDNLIDNISRNASEIELTLEQFTNTNLYSEMDDLIKIPNSYMSEELISGQRREDKLNESNEYLETNNNDNSELNGEKDKRFQMDVDKDAVPWSKSFTVNKQIRDFYERQSEKQIEDISGHTSINLFGDSDLGIEHTGDLQTKMDSSLTTLNSKRHECFSQLKKGEE